jgi:hypothetical protein
MSLDEKEVSDELTEDGLDRGSILRIASAAA